MCKSEVVGRELTVEDPTERLRGPELVIESAFLYAFYIICVKKNKVIKSIHAPKLSFYVMFFGLIVYIYNLNFCTQLQMPQSPFMWLCVICLSIFPTIISLETITIAIKLIGSTTTAILGALEPLNVILDLSNIGIMMVELSVVA